MLYYLAEWQYEQAQWQWEIGYSDWFTHWDETIAGLNHGQQVLAEYYAVPAGDDLIMEWGSGDAEWFMWADPIY